MDYTKSSDWELGTVIECREWVEGTEIGVGIGSNNISPLRLSPS